MSAVVKEVLLVEAHPGHAGVDIYHLTDGVQAIGAKNDDGSPRFQIGDHVLFVSDGSIVPEYLLRPGFWNEEKNEGRLAGNKKNRVKAAPFKGVQSDGIILYKVTDAQPITNDKKTVEDEPETVFVHLGSDVSAFLGITERT
jgi:hypothetical protein